MRPRFTAGRSAILLVPEIGLTPAAAANLHRTFGEEVAILHSALSNDERAEQWHRIHRGDARIVVGTRSAVFAPVRDLALIVVDAHGENTIVVSPGANAHVSAADVEAVRDLVEAAPVVLLQHEVPRSAVSSIGAFTCRPSCVPSSSWQSWRLPRTSLSAS